MADTPPRSSPLSSARSPGHWRAGLCNLLQRTHHLSIGSFRHCLQERFNTWPPGRPYHIMAAIPQSFHKCPTSISPFSSARFSLSRAIPAQLLSTINLVHYLLDALDDRDLASVSCCSTPSSALSPCCPRYFILHLGQAVKLGGDNAMRTGYTSILTQYTASILDGL